MPTTAPPENHQRSGRTAVVGVVVAVIAVVAYFAFGMPGMDHSGSGGTMAGMDQPSDEPMPMPLPPASFDDRLRTEDAFVVNVHVPAAVALAGTDATIPYDEIMDDERLPADTDTPILLYCKTGRMSALAAAELVDAGYDDVSYLDGGTDAWAEAGLPTVDA